MAKNNHSDDSNHKQLDTLLRFQATKGEADIYTRALKYAESIVAIENCIAVVSNLAENSSRIIAGKFAESIGLSDYDREGSIWEKKILSLMTEADRQCKFIAELRFFHYLKKIVPQKREEYYMISTLRLMAEGRRQIDVMHRMFYVYDKDCTSVVSAICLYSPLILPCFVGCYVVNSVKGVCEELTQAGDGAILSHRECQVLSLIDSGLKSREIAEILNISIHTVNRHRASILESLNVKNSHEACRIAKSMSIIGGL